MGDTMALYSFCQSGSYLSEKATAPSSMERFVFSVPPPIPSVPPPVPSVPSSCSSCTACGSCGSRISPPSGMTTTTTTLQTDDDRTLALQLRAAAIFHKMDVPPPTSPPESRTINIPPPLPLSYPPPPNTVLPFTCFPPPPIASSIAFQVGQEMALLSSSSSTLCQTSSPSGMKRMSDMEVEESPVKRPRPTGDTELRLLIQSKAAGSIIGKGGQNISRLRSENPASITVPDCPGPERVLTIGGTEEVTMKVLDEVLESLDDKDGGDADVRVLVHHSQAGCIIGKGGSKIKELRELCGGQVKVYTNCCPQSSDRVIQIIADRSRALVTIGNILESLRESPIKGINNPYNPHNFDEFYAQEYGGWSDGSKGRFPPMGRHPPMGPGPIGRGPMGPSGPLGPPGPPFGGGRRGPPFSSRGSSLGPSMHSPNGDYDSMRGLGKPFMNGGSPHNGDHSTTTQVTIPKDAAGAIIGKGGARIRKIRADSGAAISIEDSRPGSNDRIITITGSESQIKHAQYLLQQSVREFGGQSGSGGGGGGGRRF